MTTQVEIYRPTYLTAVFAVGYAVIAAELLDINRIPRTFVHRDYVLFEVIFVLVLWLCTLAAVRLQSAFNQRSAASSLGYGLLSGLVSGLLAAMALLVLSIATRGTKQDLGYLLSWQGATDFAWGATIFSFGWLIGIISGGVRYLFAAGRKGWLIGFAAFCIVVRAAVLVAHSIRHQPLW